MERFQHWNGDFAVGFRENNQTVKDSTTGFGNILEFHSEL